MNVQQTFAACDLLTAAITTVIASGDEDIARELVPELDRIRTVLHEQATPKRIIRLQEEAVSRP